MATDIEIFIGTSQDFLLSFKVKKNDNDEHVLQRYIAHRCHNGSIISMDTKGRYLATGGGDDRIVVVDLKLNRDVHEIVRHEGSINSLLFTNKGNDLLSGSEDGRLEATTVGSWKPTKIWKKPHTGKAVLKVCLHPSDKFALTLGKDGTLRGWDMCKGTQINTFNTKDLSDADITLDNVELSTDGSKFAMSGAKTVTIMSLTGDEPYGELTLKSRVTSMCWLDSQNLLIGLENGSIEWLNTKTSEQTNIPDIHTRRIKGMHCLNGFLGTICSSGTISLWVVTILQKRLTLICTTSDESIRPTCIKLIDTIENRYKDKCNVDAEALKESLPRNVKNSRPISTTGKVIVEADGNDQSQNFDQQITDGDTDTEIVVVPEETLKNKKAKASKRKNPTATSPDVESTFVPTEVPKRKKSSVTQDSIEVEQSTVTKRKRTLTTSIDAKVPKKKKTTVLPMDVVSTNSIKSGHTKEPKRKAAKNTVYKPIVVRSPNLDDDFEDPNKKRQQKKKKSIGKIEQPAVKQKLPKIKLSKNSQDIPSVKGSKKKLNLSLPALSVATPVPKKKTKTATPKSCPPMQEKGNAKQSKKQGQKLEFAAAEPSTKRSKKTM